MIPEGSAVRAKVHGKDSPGEESAVAIDDAPQNTTPGDKDPKGAEDSPLIKSRKRTSPKSNRTYSAPAKRKEDIDKSAAPLKSDASRSSSLPDDKYDFNLPVTTPDPKMQKIPHRLQKVSPSNL